MFRTLLREFAEMTVELLAGRAANLRREREELDPVTTVNVGSAAS